MTISSRTELLTPISGYYGSLVDVAIDRFGRMSEREISRDSLEFLRDFLRGITSVHAYGVFGVRARNVELL